MNRKEELQEIKASLHRAFQGLKSDSVLGKGDVASYQERLRKNQPVELVDIEEYSARLQHVRDTAITAAKGTEDIAAEQTFLKSLTFREIQNRYEEIAKAHFQTFRWIFQDDMHTGASQKVDLGFRRWLETGGGHFWLEGKAGSGKSTLMKFICEQEETKRYLTEWARAANKELVIAKHFFWHSGTPLQKSQQGLLRSLLFEVFRASPGLMRVSPRFNSPDCELDDWTRQELFDSFQTLGIQNIKTRFCFFIDGLDEYYGDHNELIELVTSLVNIPDFKICVSSRPWQQFRDAFGQVRDTTLRLQDLTRTDISSYVRQKFLSNIHFYELSIRDTRYTELLESVVDRAEGVFLWVFLVVKSLLEGIQNQDLLPDLEYRLNLLPPNLESYFRHILGQIDVAYRKRTAEAFQVALASPGPPLLSIYTIIDRFEERRSSEVQDGVGDLTIHTLEEANEKTERRLDARCKGPLEISRGNADQDILLRNRVTFLHRSVRDFLQNQDMQELFQAQLDETYNANFSVCRALKAAIEMTTADGLKGLWSSPEAERELIHAILYQVRSIEVQHPGSELMHQAHLLLDETEGLLRNTKWKWKRKKLEFVGLSIEYRVGEYLKHRLSVRPQLPTMYRERPLLDRALQPAELHFTGETSYADIETINLLLEMHANPNAGYHDSTVWARFLGFLEKNDDFFNSPDTYAILLELVKHGADLKVGVNQCVRQMRWQTTGRPGNIYHGGDLVQWEKAQEVLQQHLTPERYGHLMMVAGRQKKAWLGIGAVSNSECQMRQQKCLSPYPAKSIGAQASREAAQAQYNQETTC